MNEKLLDHQEKRELLQRMDFAVRCGTALDAFCETEGIETETLLAHLAELQKLGTGGINPFLPDIERNRHRLPDKIRAIEKMLAYNIKTGTPLRHICALADISIATFNNWKILMPPGELERLEKISAAQRTPGNKNKAPASHPTTLRDEALKRAQVDGVITDVNNGMPLTDALKKAEVNMHNFFRWEKRFATVKRTPSKFTPTVPGEEAQRRARVVDGIITEINNGTPLAAALKQAGIDYAVFHSWEKRHATVKRAQRRAPWQNTTTDPRQKSRVADEIITAVNNGERLCDAVKAAGLTIPTFRSWEKRHATVKRTPSWPFGRPRATDTSHKTRMVDEIIAAVNNGASVANAVKASAISEGTFYRWEKYATLKRETDTLLDEAEKRRVTDGIIADVNNGAPLLETVKKWGVLKQTFYTWEKTHATLKRAVTGKGCRARPRPT